MTCDNRGCKHRTENKRCACVKKLKIDSGGRCTSFEKGFMYYIDLVYEALDGNNFIPASRLTKDMKIGLYYVMKIFNLAFSEISCGPVLGRAVMLKDSEGGKGLTTDEITQRPINHEEFNKVYVDFTNGILPGESKEPQEKPKVVSQPFGWLSPTGTFTEGDFGEHERAAYAIIEERFFDEWSQLRHDSGIDTAREFLSRVKGYALIHNPTGFGEYIVSHEKPLTKKQKDFLYGYFIDMGDSFMANRFVEDD